MTLESKRGKSAAAGGRVDTESGAAEQRAIDEGGGVGEDDGVEFAEAAPAKSDLARAVARLKADTVAAAARRERLPQPLFWSLFHTELREIKEAKEKARLLREALETLD